MERCVVSIIMPVYNAWDFLRESIKDITEQTLSEFELICINDGSKDNSLSLLEKISMQDGRIKVISQENLGAGAARNRGMKEAKGKYLLFLDADDRFEKNMLEEMVQKAEELQTDVLVCNGDRFDYTTHQKSKAPWLLNLMHLCEDSIQTGVLTKEDKEKEVLSFTNTTIWNKLWRRTYIEEKRIQFQEIYVVDSMYFVMMGLIMAQRIGILDKKLIHYRSDNPTGQIKNHDKNPTGIYDALHEVKIELERRRLYEKYKIVFVHFAAENCMKRLKMLKTYEGVTSLYDVLHNYGLHKLEITEECLRNESMQEFAEKYKWICKYSYEEYLYHRQRELENTGLLTSYAYKLPELGLKRGSKVVLYGSGNVGKSYYIQLVNQGRYRIIGWADRNFLNANFPVQSVEAIQSLEYDLVLIAVLKRETADSIKKELADMGMLPEKIFWRQPEEI